MNPIGHVHGKLVRPAGVHVRGVRWLYHSGFYDGPLSGMVTSPATGPAPSYDVLARAISDEMKETT